MKLHEYQAKQFFTEYGIAVPEGILVNRVDEVDAALDRLGGDRWWIKAQIHAGGRGKAGGVHCATSREEARQYVGNFLGRLLVTNQTDARGQPVSSVLIEKPVAVARELYLALLVDRASAKIMVLTSQYGGLDVEEMARLEPDKVYSLTADLVMGFQPSHSRRISYKLALEEVVQQRLQALLMNLYRLFKDKDLTFLEINPLCIDETGDLIALDAKLDVDDNALYRQPFLQHLRDYLQEDKREYEALELGVSYLSLKGNIGCVVNGAGMAMATADLIKMQGGEPGSVLSVGGGADARKVAEAFKVIGCDENVRAILINVFGGIDCCDEIIRGVAQASGEMQVTVPVIARLEGTNAEEGRELLKNSGLNVVFVQDLNEAALSVINAVRGRV